MKKIDYKSLSVSLILPTFNEAKNIHNLLVRLASIEDISISEIIIVDDDSSDGTPEIVRDLHRKDNRIRLISRVGRSGLASAMGLQSPDEVFGGKPSIQQMLPDDRKHIKIDKNLEGILTRDYSDLMKHPKMQGRK